MISAHRGGRYLTGYPENALETFQYVLSHTPAILEFDVNMTADSVLILMHDSGLERTTTGSGKVMAQTWDSIKQLNLVDDMGNETSYHIPTLASVFRWLRNKTIATVDIKRGVPHDKVVAMIENYKVEDYAVVITYSIEDAVKIHELNPKLMLSVTIRNMAEYERFKVSGIPAQNVVAFTGTVESSPALYKVLNKEGIRCILGTMGNLDKRAAAVGPQVYQQLIENGADILSTDRPLEAGKALKIIE